MWKWLVALVVFVILLVVVLGARRAGAQEGAAQDGTVAGDVMLAVVANLRSEGVQTRIVETQIARSDEDVTNALTLMVKTGVRIEEVEGRAQVVNLPADITDGPAADTLIELLKPYTQIGDYVMRLEVGRGDTPKSTVVTVSADGSRKNGPLLLASRLKSVAVEAPPPLDRYNIDIESTYVLSRYLWGEPAELIGLHMRGGCSNGTCQGCEAAALTAISGFFSYVRVTPEPATFPQRGTVDKTRQCCSKHIAYESGLSIDAALKSLKLKDFESDGHIDLSKFAPFSHVSGSINPGLCCPR